MIAICQGPDCGIRFKVVGSRSARYHTRNCAKKAGQARYREQGRTYSRTDTHVELLRELIGERDGWRCHMCGGEVPKHAEQYAPESASIDHIVPIALGGPNIAANVALAHLRCNIQEAGIIGMLVRS